MNIKLEKHPHACKYMLAVHMYIIVETFVLVDTLGAMSFYHKERKPTRHYRSLAFVMYTTNIIACILNSTKVYFYEF